jgi:hypothetical protein
MHAKNNQCYAATITQQGMQKNEKPAEKSQIFYGMKVCIFCAPKYFTKPLLPAKD